MEFPVDDAWAMRWVGAAGPPFLSMYEAKGLLLPLSITTTTTTVISQSRNTIRTINLFKSDVKEKKPQESTLAEETAEGPRLDILPPERLSVKKNQWRSPNNVNRRA